MQQNPNEYVQKYSEVINKMYVQRYNDESHLIIENILCLNKTLTDIIIQPFIKQCLYEFELCHRVETECIKINDSIDLNGIVQHHIACLNHHGFKDKFKYVINVSSFEVNSTGGSSETYNCLLVFNSKELMNNILYLLRLNGNTA